MHQMNTFPSKALDSGNKTSLNTLNNRFADACVYTFSLLAKQLLPVVSWPPLYYERIWIAHWIKYLVESCL